MRVTRYLIINKPKGWGARPSVRVTTKAPRLGPRERSISVTLDLPDSLWDEPQLEATITVPDDKVSAPVIDAEVMDNIQEVLSQQLGVSLEISVIEQDQRELTE